MGRFRLCQAARDQLSSPPTIAASPLGLCVRPSGTRSFILLRMVCGRGRYATIGNADAMTLVQARKEARKLLVSFLDTPERRDRPMTSGRPMKAFADEFLKR